METLKRSAIRLLRLIFDTLALALKAGDDLFPKDELGNTILTDAHYTEAWKEMEKLVKEGLVKSIGKERQVTV